MIMVWLNVCYTCEDSYKFHPYGIGLVFQRDKDGTTAIGRVLNKHGGSRLGCYCGYTMKRSNEEMLLSLDYDDNDDDDILRWKKILVNPEQRTLGR